jgi:signal transduction histidine kinase
MTVLNSVLGAANRLVEWFLPRESKRALSDTRVETSFIFLHLFGPLMGQVIGLFLFYADPNPGLEVLVIELTICAFWVLPFSLKKWGNIKAVAYASTQMLTFVALFGAFHYGGMSSPFVPWLLIALLLGFFYLAGSEKLLLSSLAIQLCCFAGAAMLSNGFPMRVDYADIAEVNLISVFAATVYMSWMAIYYALVVGDKSEALKEAERHRETTLRLRQAKAFAEQANRNKSIFLAKMSHELRTPLNAVIGYSEILLEDAEASGGSAQKLADLKRINAAGSHLLALVADVLDLSRIEANMIELNSAPFDLYAFLDDIAANTKQLIETHGNRFEIVRPAETISLTNDQLKLRQILLNLLSNAAKFTQDGMVTLAVRHNNSGWIEFEVSDTGIGISESDLPHLFREFGQANAATAKAYGGTGLGLVLTQRFATLMGGGVKVRSEVGKGSTFTVRVPVAVGPSSASEPGLLEPAAA